MSVDKTNGKSVDLGHEKQDFDRIDAGPRRDHVSNQDPELKAAWYDDLFVGFCVIVYLADVITDILVSVKYFNNQDYIWFSLTLSCVLGASIVMMIFSLKWFYDDTAEQISKARTVLLHLVQLGPLLRYWDAYFHGRKSRETTNDSRYYNIYVEQWRDLTMLRLFEVFIESAPQLVLQLYILAYNREFDKEKDWLTACSACLSLLSLSTSIVSYSKALRDASENKGKMSWWGFGCQIVWRLSMVASRIVTLVLFASVYRSWILLVIGFHWVVMTAWVLYQDTSFCKNKTLERFFAIVIGFIYIFCFFNTKDGFTRRRLVVFYMIMFMEDCVLMVMWIPYRSEYGAVFVAAFVMVFGGFFLGVVAMFLYYQCYHPSLEVQGICVRTRHNVPRAEGVVYKWLCCEKCCLIRLHEDEFLDPPTGSPLHVDIPAYRGSVGRSVSGNRTASPTFESEFLVHQPSELQRQYSLDKQKIKKEKAEKARRLHERENGMQNGTCVNIFPDIQGSEDVPQDVQSSKAGEHSNGFVNNEERHGGQNGGIDVCGCGGPRVSNEKTETKQKYDRGWHCGTDDMKETGASSGKSKQVCDDGLHCGSDDEQKTETSLVKSNKKCDDGLHCGTDDERENETSEQINRLPCHTAVNCGTGIEEGSGTTVPKSKTLCDDGLHCGTDDEEEPETSISKTKSSHGRLARGMVFKDIDVNTSKRAIRPDCGTDDNKEYGTSGSDNGESVEVHCGTDGVEDKGELMSTLPKKQCRKYDLLNFQHRYSIVSDCISLSSSSSEAEDEVAKEDQNSRNKHRESRIGGASSSNQVRDINSNHEINQSSSTVGEGHCSSTSASASKNAITGEETKKSYSHKSKQADRVSFPNFVATNLKRGRFSSLRRSKENVVEESSTKSRRNTVDFSEFTTETMCNTSKYPGTAKPLTPRRSESVREKFEKLTLRYEEEV